MLAGLFVYISQKYVRLGTMKLLVFLVLPPLCISYAAVPTEKLPTVVISILVRNKAHTLPYFLSLLEKQIYDKNRLSLIIVSDHNEDSSATVLNTWVNEINGLYHSVDYTLQDEEQRFPDEGGSPYWSNQRMGHLITLREAALKKARLMWADYLWLLDADAFLTNPETLRYLVNQNKTLVAPMLTSNGFYSNFWCGMTEDHYYIRTDEYKPILKREKKGCFAVPMIHSATLINLRKKESDHLTFIASKVDDYKGPTDDIITFAIAANKSEIPLFICNEKPFGFIMPPLDKEDSLSLDIEQFMNLKLEALITELPFPVSKALREFVTPPMRYDVGVDVTYVINLQRRKERRLRMEQCLYELGMDAEFVDAVDGRALSDEKIRQLGIVQMPEYRDPYHHRPMTTGEIGCFLSHYGIWQKVVETGKRIALVLEDDVRFEPFFQRKVFALLEEMKKINLEWDLVYLGRKRLKDDEPWVAGSSSLVHVGYSYWTLGYLITDEGARKLLEPDPLSKLVPVDEYLPIMFDRHPEEKWKEYFPKRDLKAFSVSPLLIFPTHYTGEIGYISDTEDSETVTAFKITKEDL